MRHTIPLLSLCLALSACGGSSNSGGFFVFGDGQPPNDEGAIIAIGDSSADMPEAGSPLAALSAIPLVGGVLGDTLGGGTPDDPLCGSYASPSAEFTACEAKNFARVTEAPREQLTNPTFMQRLVEQSTGNFVDYLMRGLSDPSRLIASPSMSVSLNTPLTPLCATYALPCAGDPFRYPDIDPFYRDEAVVEKVDFYDRECARLSGRVWRPLGSEGQKLPTVVIENGSVQAPEPLYWWMAQALVRSGYAVMTFDPRGQGRSDMQTPAFGQGTNINPAVFWEGLVDAIDFFRSTPDTPYPHNITCQASYPTAVTAFNPQHAVQDQSRLGIAGHSLGGTGVSVVQSYGAMGAEPWPGKLDATNPVDVAVAWDGLATPGQAPGGFGGVIPSMGEQPAVVPRVPSMGQNSEYGLTPMPNLQAPDPDEKLAPLRAWQAAGVPVYEFTIRGSTHYEWSQIPLFPTTSWCPEVVDNRCVGGWGRPMAEFFSLAWLDRWLKVAGEPGFDDADARLQSTRFNERLSFYSHSARDFPLRNGARQRCDNLLEGCAP
ncbi:hypothetical protein DFR26_0442 [Paraperlucidibaca baekdonensis]|uniref:Uncharacterized protein n=1 Tax=Paraperlucidibaca baekdonensis TaxID=748120 RepID=A0A3E0H9B4_9GAMM|nr:hypothetical protein [Paraperlucidibaca baekdonensis]REH40243.1 hypothetical protein DFR26_0442 [Paraperlucidibaca baekdonensis]